MVPSILQLGLNFTSFVKVLGAVMLVKQSYLQGFFFLHNTLFVVIIHFSLLFTIDIFSMLCLCLTDSHCWTNW